MTSRKRSPMWTVLAHCARQVEPLTADVAGAINRAARMLPGYVNGWCWAHLTEDERSELHAAADAAHATHDKDGDLAERMERESFANRAHNGRLAQAGAGRRGG